MAADAARMTGAGTDRLALFAGLCDEARACRRCPAMEGRRRVLSSANGLPGATIHVCGTGRNDHHLAEAAFKALGRALRSACAPDPRRRGAASTKGTLG